jgi:hypothetical protein
MVGFQQLHQLQNTVIESPVSRLTPSIIRNG